jgi:hypothetical protein
VAVRETASSASLTAWLTRLIKSFEMRGFSAFWRIIRFANLFTADAANSTSRKFGARAVFALLAALNAVSNNYFACRLTSASKSAALTVLQTVEISLAKRTTAVFAA